MGKVRFAVIGTNFITDWFLEAARKNEEFALEAVYSRSLERAAQFAQKYGVRKTYDDLDRMLSDSAIDAVYIASPNTFHTQQALRAMAHKKHVLVEKPAAPSEMEFLEMLAATREHGVALMEAMRPAHSPGLREVKKYIREVAPVRFARIAYCQYSSRYDAFKEGRVLNAFDPTLKNGSLMDIGVYCVHVLVSLFGEPGCVNAQAFQLHNGIDGAGAILAQYPDMLAELAYSKISNSHSGSELQGEGGTLLIDDICNPKELVLRRRGAAEEQIPIPVTEFGMGAELDTFLRIIRSGSGADEYQRNTLLTLRVMDEARRQTGLDFTRKPACTAQCKWGDEQ